MATPEEIAAAVAAIQGAKTGQGSPLMPVPADQLDPVTADFLQRSNDRYMQEGIPQQPEPEPAVRDAYDTPTQNQVGTNAMVGHIGSMDTETEMMRKLAGGGQVATGPGAAPLPEALNWQKAGGSENIRQQQDAITQQEAAIQSKGMDESQVNQKMSEVYDGLAMDTSRVMGNAQAQYDRDMAAYQQRMEMLDQKSKQIAAHQYDQGAFFRSPGGLLAALGAAMAVGASNDKTIGVKLINQYIDREARGFQQQHENMQADLLGLRTNVGEFRQLMGSRQAGDMVHLARMKDIAAMQMDSLASQLKSKDAISNANLITGKLRQESAELMMRATMIAHVDPKMVPAQLAKYYYQNGDTTTFGPKGQQAPAGAPPAAGGGSVLANTANAVGKSIATGPAKAGERVAQTVVNRDEARSAGAKNARAQRFQERTGIDARIYNQYTDSLYRKLDAIVTLESKGDPKKRGEAVAKIFSNLTPDRMNATREAFAKVVSRGAAVRGLNEQIEWLKHDPNFTKNGKLDRDAIDKTFSTGIGRLMSMTPYEMHRAMKDSLLAGGYTGEAAERRIQAGINWIQNVQMATTAYSHEMYGAALTGAKGDPDTEKANLKRIISTYDNFGTVENFAKNASKHFGDEMGAQFSAMDDLALLKLLENYGAEQPELATPGKAGK